MNGEMPGLDAGPGYNFSLKGRGRRPCPLIVSMEGKHLKRTDGDIRGIDDDLRQ